MDRRETPDFQQWKNFWLPPPTARHCRQPRYTLHTIRNFPQKWLPWRQCWCVAIDKEREFTFLTIWTNEFYKLLPTELQHSPPWGPPFYRKDQKERSSFIISPQCHESQKAQGRSPWIASCGRKNDHRCSHQMTWLSLIVSECCHPLKDLFQTSYAANYQRVRHSMNPVMMLLSTWPSWIRYLPGPPSRGSLVLLECTSSAGVWKTADSSRTWQQSPLPRLPPNDPHQW